MSFMTSRRPDTFQVWNFIDTVPKNTSSTPGHFRDYGYITLGLGKTFHQSGGAWNAESYWTDQEEKPYFPYKAGSCPHGGQGGGHCVQKDEEIYDW
jgi:arylsulfatase A-like enzyme